MGWGEWDRCSFIPTLWQKCLLSLERRGIFSWICDICKHFGTSELEVWSICACVNCNLSMALTIYCPNVSWKTSYASIFQLPDMVWRSNLYWGYPLPNKFDWWRHQFDYILSQMTENEKFLTENPNVSDSFEIITQKQFEGTSSCSNQNMTWKQDDKDVKYG